MKKAKQLVITKKDSSSNYTTSEYFDTSTYNNTDTTDSTDTTETDFDTTSQSKIKTIKVSNSKKKSKT
jgi:hypothetical protein